MDITIKKALTYNGVSLQPGQSARIPDADALALIASHSAIPSNQAADKDERLLGQIATLGLAQYAYDSSGNPVGLADPSGNISALSRANVIVLDSATIGSTTGWLPASANPERYGFKLLSGASSGITIDGSNDGGTSAGQVATVSLDTTGTTLISAPIKPLYPYIRFTVSSGAGVAQIARGM